MLFKSTTLKLLQRVSLYSFESPSNHARHYFSRFPLAGFTNNLLIKQRRQLLNYDIVPIIISARQYAKGKDKKKEKAKGPVQINDAQLSELLNLEQLRGNMEKSLEKLKEDFVKNLSVRLENAQIIGSVESISVNVDGANHTLQELGQITRKNPKLIVVNMAMFPQAIPAAVKALQKSGMNLNPQQEGTTLYIPTPKVTREHREGLVKSAKAFFVKCKDSIRDTQVKNIKSVKNKTGVSEDLVKSVENQIIAISDGYIKKAEEFLVKKQQELLGE